MKILFTTESEEWDSIIDSRFGRAAGFLIYDENTGEKNWHSNAENISEAHGVGIKVSQKVADIGVEAIITGGNIGPKAFDLINKAGIRAYIRAGNITIKEAYKKFKNGELIEMKSKNNIR